MSIIQSIILGLTEGLTEFIPISSSGHLIIVRKILGLPLEGSLSFDAVVQLAASLAVAVYFRKDIWNIMRAFIAWLAKKPADQRYQSLILPLIIGTIPAVILGLILEKKMDTVFRDSTAIVAISLLAGSALFYLAERRFNLSRHQESLGESSPFNGRPNHSEDSPRLSPKKGLIIGFYQCLALVPGFSRSGATISGGLLSGLDRETATRFSFLLALPIIFGSGLLKFWEIMKSGAITAEALSIFWASLFAFASGLLAIHYLLKFLRNHSLNWFGAYRVILAIIILLWLS